MKLVSKRRVLLVDGNNIAWRWTMASIGEQLKTTTGIVTTVCYGIIESIIKANKCLSDVASSRIGMAQKIYYDDVIVCWDARGTNWRHSIYPDYKESRSDEKRRKLKAEVMPYIDTAKDFLSALNVKQIEVAQLEGDDILAVLANMYEQSGWTVTLLSGDKDLLQLLRWGKVIIHDGKDTFRDEGWFWSEHGFSPLRWPEAKALMGDSGDDVPGVKGIGKKLSNAIVQACEFVPNMEVDELPKIKRFSDKVKERLKHFVADGNLYRNYLLVRLTPNLSELRITGDLLSAFRAEYNKVAGQSTVNPSIFMMSLQRYEMKRYMESYRDVMNSLGLKAA